MCVLHVDRRPRDVTEATNARGMMSTSAFDLIRPTIATCVAFPGVYSGGWLASWRLVRANFIIEAHHRQPSRIKTRISNHHPATPHSRASVLWSQARDATSWLHIDMMTHNSRHVHMQDNELCVFTEHHVAPILPAKNTAMPLRREPAGGHPSSWSEDW